MHHAPFSGVRVFTVYELICCVIILFVCYVGIELAVDVFPAVFTQTLSLFSALARGSDEAKRKH